MLINKNSLSVLNHVSKDGRSFENVFIFKDCTIGTDGASLLKIGHPKNYNEEDFPHPENAGGSAENLNMIAISPSSAKSLLKFIPKRSKGQSEMVEMVKIDVEKTNANGHLIASVSDMENPQTLKIKCVDVQPLDFERFFPKGEAKMTIYINPEKLGELLLTMSNNLNKRGIQIIKMELFEQGAPIVFSAENKETDQKMSALIMPCRGW